MTDFTWTDESVARLRAMRAGGMSFGQIAAQLGCTRNGAIGKAARINLPKQNISRGPWPIVRRKPKRKPRSFVMFGHPEPQPTPMGMPIEPPLPPGKRCTIFDVTGCRFIHGDPRDADHSYCNVPRVEGLSYCQEHALLCLTPPGSHRDWR